MSADTSIAGLNARAALVGEEDITNSAAFVALEEAVAGGKLSEEKCAVLKQAYRDLHSAVLGTYKNEQRLLAEARRLNEESMSQRVDSEMKEGGAYETQATLSDLKRELVKQDAQAETCKQRQDTLQLQVAELEHTKQSLQLELERSQQDLMDEAAPLISSAQQEVQSLETDIERQTKTETSLRSQLDSLLQSKQQMYSEKDMLSSEKVKVSTELAASREKPAKVRKQADVVEQATRNLAAELRHMESEASNLDKQVSDQKSLSKKADDDRLDLAVELDRFNSNIEQKNGQLAQIAKDLDIAKDDSISHLAVRAKLDMDHINVQRDLRRETDSVVRKIREKDAWVRSVKQAETALSATQDSLPNLRMQIDELRRAVETSKYQGKKRRAEMEELRREVDLFMHGYLRQEKQGGRVEEQYLGLQKEIRGQEDDTVVLARETREGAKRISKLTVNREKAARDAANSRANVKRGVEEVGMRDLVIADLRKKVTDYTQRTAHLQRMYEAVKSERNKYVNAIQAGTQALAEMREKLRILQNEIDILRAESAEKDRDLTRRKLVYHNSIAARDSLQNEANKAAFQYRVTQEKIDQQIGEIDKLNAIINATEEAMLRLKKMYEIAVEDRNYTGIQLIDRNDELCILYEKANIQTAILRRGELAYLEREEDLRLLSLDQREVARSITVARKVTPDLPRFQAQVVDLEAQLAEERVKTRQLCVVLESPECAERWRALGGEDPSPRELRAKLRQLEERLNMKQEQLLEKELVLDEVSALAGKVRSKAMSAREESITVARSINDVKARIRGVTRKMMAAVAELSMHQTNAMMLAKQQENMEEEVRLAEQRLARGEPPTDDAESEWVKKLRNETMYRVSKATRLASEAEHATVEQGEIRSTAPARPNAYLPEGLAIPRPYGVNAPFRPQEAGGNMRHIKTQKVRKIEI